MAFRSALKWALLQSAVKLLAGFISIKVTAVYLGPAGLALIGQLGNFVSMMASVTTGAIQTHVVRETARAVDEAERLALWRTTVRLAVLVGAVAGLATLLLARELTTILLKDAGYWPVLLLLALTLPLQGIAGVLTAIVNGLGRIATLGRVNILASLAGAAVFIPLCYWYGIWGGLTGTLLAYLASLPLLLFATRSLAPGGMLLQPLAGGVWSGEHIRAIALLVPMLLVHALTETLAPIAVRNALAAAHGLEGAGLWQAVLRLSDTYTVLIITALSMYLMPHLSASPANRFHREVMLAAFKAGAVTLILAAGVWLLRYLLIDLLFSDAFRAVAELLPFQLVGDCFKVACWPMRMALVLRVRSLAYVGVDVGIALIYVWVTYAALPGLQLHAATFAYAAAYLAAFAVLCGCIYKESRNGNRFEDRHGR